MERSPKERHEILKYILDEYGLQFKKGGEMLWWKKLYSH